MNTILKVAALLVAMAAAARAQGGVGPGGTRYFFYKSDASPDEVARLYSDFVFDGIMLSSEQRATSAEIIKRTRSELSTLMRQDPKVDARRVEVQCAQRSELRALLTSDADRRQFDDNVPPLPTILCKAGGPAP